MDNITNKRVLGTFLGQLVGDAMGTRYEFMSASSAKELLIDDIKQNGNKLEILGEGPFAVQVGQYTDDSELALGIWYSLVANKQYDIDDIVKQFYSWYHSGPFDIGGATRNAFSRGTTRKHMLENSENRRFSLSNGCLMKISPIGVVNHIFKKKYDLAELAKDVCELTNPHPICVDMCVCYVEAINTAIETGSPIQAFLRAQKCAKFEITKLILNDAQTKITPTKRINFDNNQIIEEVKADGGFQGYIGVAFQNAFYHLLNTPKQDSKGLNGFKNMLAQTICLGGDVDTNACIAGALYGACHSDDIIPVKFTNTVLNFRNDEDRINIYECLDHFDLYEKLTEMVTNK